MEYFDLTVPQKNILNLRKIYEGTSISNICGAIIFDRRLDSELLSHAVNEALRMQSGMRMRFCEQDGKTCQYVREHEYENFGQEVFRSREELERFGREFASVPFELHGSRMYRIKLFELESRSGVIMCADHLITDAWTYSILANDVYKIYVSLSEDKAADLPEYDFIGYASGEEKYFSSSRYAADREYWTEKCARAPLPLTLGTRRNGGYIPSAERVTEKIPPDISGEIAAFCDLHGISSPVLFEAAAAIYLSKAYGVSSVTLGVPVLNRSSAREKKTAGNYILTLPLITEISGDDTALSVCGKISAGNREIFRHRKYPYAEIIKEARGGLYSVMVSCQNAEINMNASTVWFPNGFSEIPLSLHFDDRDRTGSCTVTADFQTEIFPRPEEVSLIIKRIIYVIRQIASGGDIPVSIMTILPYGEYREIIFGMNRTEAKYPDKKCVHELFSERAAKTPDKTALVFRGRSFTCRELDRMSDALANHLREKGIGRNDIVPIAAKRSPYMLIAMIAALKAGGAYMPVSPDYPEKRISYMLSDAGAKLMLTYGFSAGLTEEIALDSFDYSHDAPAPENVNSPDDICYVIYTSGSSGKPKGALVTHRNAVNYCSENRFNVCGGIFDGSVSGIVSVTNFIFDIFVTESLLPLLRGIKIFLADEEESVSQAKLSRLITENGIDVIQTTPTKMRGYILDGKNLKYLSSLKKIILGGEPFPADLYRELKKHTGAEIYNIYGPAETTVWSSFSRVGEGDITVGKPIANTMIYVLDENGEPLPFGIEGELCISGDGVGKGYINSPALTAERFIPDPFVKGKTLYRTGDTALIRTDGNIEFLGRKDSQIKLRGMRVEPGETESAMNSHKGVDLAAVSVINDGKSAYLAGYYTSSSGTEPKELREYLSSLLPAHMMPRFIIKTDSIPLTPSGKIDRKSLPEPDISQEAAGYSAPSSRAEKLLCGMMARVLGIPRIGADDDFFEAGGDSFSAMELSAKAEEIGISIPLRSIFRYRTARRICAHIKSGKTPPARQDDAYARYPLPRSEGDIAAFRLFSRLTGKIYRFEVSGLEGLDMSRKYIFCANHESDLDFMWLLAALCRKADIRDFCALIAEEHLGKAVPREVFRITGGIPVERGGDFTGALRRAEEVISGEKKYLLIHPEGTRTRTGKLGNFKQGAAAISKNTGIEIIPVCIRGAHKIFPPSEKLPRVINPEIYRRYRLQIKFGKPISPAGLSRGQITEAVRRQIISLKTEGKK